MSDRWNSGAQRRQLWLIKLFGFLHTGLHDWNARTHTDFFPCLFFFFFLTIRHKISSASSLAQGPGGEEGVKWKAVEAASISRRSVWRWWDRAAGKILKGRCGCSNVGSNSRKFPLNPVCWVFCACGQLGRGGEDGEREERRERPNKGTEAQATCHLMQWEKQIVLGKMQKGRAAQSQTHQLAG